MKTTTQRVVTAVPRVSLSAMSGPELFFGLIGAVGTDLQLVSQLLAQNLRRVGYNSHEIRVSSLLHSLDRYASLANSAGRSEFERIKAHMQAGSELRKLARTGDILALMSVSQIRQLRREFGETTLEPSRTPLPRTAYIIRSIKHPSEVNALRDIYGRAFFRDPPTARVVNE